MPPPRGFTKAEFQLRTQRAQALMAEHGLSALLLTTEPEIRYYSGFLTRFWESPTRPWFLLVPCDGDPVAVIPAIGAHLMSQTWIGDIRTWNAPDYADDGIGLLSATINDLLPEGAAVGLADGMESHVRMPRRGLEQLTNLIGSRRVVSDHAVTRTLRLVKSEAEIAKIGNAAGIADRAFARLAEVEVLGTPLSHIFRRFQMLCLDEGADWVPYLAGAAGRGGYEDVISPATDDPVQPGDVLMLDTGLVWDGYFCDFNRNFSIGPPSAAVAEAHALLIAATRAAYDVARPGAVVSDLVDATASVLGARTAPGRLGHGLGQQLTEWPSLIAADRTPLAPGMVLTLEPCISMPDGKIMVHEENIVVRDDGAEFLSTPEGPELRVL